jgi:phosphate-selective porin
MKKLAVLVIGALLPCASSFAQADADRLRKLEEAVRQLQQENVDLKREVNQLKSTPPAASPPGTNWLADVMKPDKRSPFVLPLGKELKLKLGGFIQGQGEFGDPGSFEGNFSDNVIGTSRVPLNDRFRLRRARINVSGEVLEDFDFKLEGEFQNADGISGGRTGFSGTDLFLNWHRFPEAQIKFGQWKAPFGLEQLTSDTALFTAERSLVTTALTPERQVGAAIWGKPLVNIVPKNLTDVIEYSFGIYNGNGRNTVVNDDNTFMFVGRLSSTPFKGELWGHPASWRLGANGYRSRFAPGTRISQSGGLSLNADGALTAFTPTGLAQGEGWGVDQWLNFGPFDLIAEYLEGNFRPKDNTAFNEFTANGYYVQGSYYLPFLGGKKFQLVGKWESYNPGQAEEDDIKSVTGGLNYYINGDALKLMLDYIHTWSDFRDNNPVADETEFDLLLARVQLMF